MGILLFGVSGGEILLIIVVILVLFGADKIPELVRSFGKGMNEFKKAADEIKRELVESANDIKQDALELTRDVQNEINSASSEIKQTATDFVPYEEVYGSGQEDGYDNTTAQSEAPQTTTQERISRKKTGQV
ncbi:MAG: twin-arginine translocase TatA/TatE family subunit [Breznakibacter sp.]